MPLHIFCTYPTLYETSRGASQYLQRNRKCMSKVKISLSSYTILHYIFLFYFRFSWMHQGTVRRKDYKLCQILILRSSIFFTDFSRQMYNLCSLYWMNLVGCTSKSDGIKIHDLVNYLRTIQVPILSLIGSNRIESQT